MLPAARHALGAAARVCPLLLPAAPQGGARRRYREVVKVPKSDDMMAVQYGHQMDVVWTWLNRGANVCWLGDFGELMEMYNTLDARAEAEWAAKHDGKGPADYAEYVDYVARKRVFDRLWVPNPISVLSNAFSEERFHTWVEEVYPYSNFKYLPISVFASLMKSYKVHARPIEYPCLGRAGQNVPVEYLHGVPSVPKDYPPVTLLRNYLSQLTQDNVIAKDKRHHVLIPNAGNHGGLVPLTVLNLKAFRGSVHAIDSDPEVIDTILRNYQAQKRNKNEFIRRAQRVAHEVGQRAVPRDPFRRFTLAVLCPGWLGAGVDGRETLSGYYDLQAQDPRDILFNHTFFAGRAGGADITTMLDEVEGRMNAGGRVIVLWSNLDNLVNKTDTHPVIRELETNERYSLEHFEDVPCPLVTPGLMKRHGSVFFADLIRKSRAELWVLRVNRPMLDTPQDPVYEEQGLQVVDARDARDDAHALVVQDTPPDAPAMSAEKTDAQLIGEYFYPKPEGNFNYDQTKRLYRRDKRLVSEAPKPSAEGIAQQRLLQAQHFAAEEERRQKAIRYQKLVDLGLRADPQTVKTAKAAQPRQPQRKSGSIVRF